MKPTINITIKPDGTVEIAPTGFKGRKCKDATKFLEQALGMEIAEADRKLTPEYNQVEVNTEQKQRA